jgi:hypothetical protein
MDKVELRFRLVCVNPAHILFVNLINMALWALIKGTALQALFRR